MCFFSDENVKTAKLMTREENTRQHKLKHYRDRTYITQVDTSTGTDAAAKIQF